LTKLNLDLYFYQVLHLVSEAVKDLACKLFAFNRYVMKQPSRLSVPGSAVRGAL